MTDNYFDVMKICELINPEGQKPNQYEILESYGYTKTKYETELKKLVEEGQDTVTIDYKNCLGTGGISNVFACNVKKEINIECKYAIKLIDITNPKKENISVYDQIVPLCNINHENVISVDSLKVIKKKKNYFYGIVFQYIDKITTLSDFITNNPTPLTIGETYKIIDGLVAGIKAMHKKDLIHSDITLKNILITPDKSIVYIDPDVTKLYWKNQLDNSLKFISSMAGSENKYKVDKYGTDIIDNILSEDIYKMNTMIKKILEISEIDGSSFITKISTMAESEKQINSLFKDIFDVR